MASQAVLDLLINLEGEAQAMKGLSNIGGAVGMLAGGALTALTVGAGAATAAVTGIGVAGVAAASSLEQEMANTAAIMGLTGDEAAELKGLVNDLALDPALKVSATEAMQAIQELGAQGLRVEQISGGAARAVVLLANATGGTYVQSATVATDVMALWNMEASQMEEAINGITSVANVSKFGIDDYTLAIAQGGGVAAAVGVKYEDFNATIAAISPYFNSGSDAGTSYKTMLQRLVPATNPAIDAFRELGLITEDGTNKFFDANGQMVEGAEMAGILHDALKDLSDEDRNRLVTQAFGTDAMRAALGLSELTEEQYRTMMATMDETSAADAAATRMNTFAGAMEIAGGVMEALSIQIGEALLPLLRPLVEQFSAMASEHGPAFVARVGEIAAMLGERLPGAIQFVMDAFTTFQQALSGDWADSGVIQPLHRVIGVIGQVVAAFGEDGLSGAFAVLLPYAQQAFGALVAWIQEQLPGWIATLQHWGRVAWLWLEEAIPPLLEAAGRAFVGLLTWVQGQLPGWMEKLGQWATAAVEWLEEAIPPLMVAAADFLTSLLDWGTTQVLPRLTELAGEMAKALYEWITEYLIPEVLPRLGRFMAEMDLKIRTEVIPAMNRAALALGQAVVDGVVSAIRGGATIVIEAIRAVMGGMIQSALDALVAHSPSRVFMDIGEYAMKGLADGIAKNAMLPALATADAMGGMIDAATMTSLPTVASTFGMGSAGGSFGGSSTSAGTTVVMHNTFHVASDMDVEAVAYQIATVISRRR